ncbi:MAG: ATPase, partial [Actinomycetota bacterium]|nr:ATPase [Actinomycetota bacterium]
MSRCRLPVRYLGDRLLLTEEAAWVWVNVPTVSYDFLSDGERDALLASTTIALAALAGAEAHLLVVPDAYAVEAWRSALEDATPKPTSG